LYYAIVLTRRQSNTPSMHRWLLPYADLLTVLFVAVLALKVTPDQTNSARPAPTTTAHQLVASAEKPVLSIHAGPTNAVKTSVNALLTMRTKQLLQQWHAHQNTKGDVVLTLPQNVLFTSNAYQLSPAGQKQLNGLKPLLARCRGRIRIEGHTDSQLPAPPLSNRQLSALRASVVADALIKAIPLTPNQVVAIGHGDTHAIATNKTAAGRQANRRVELIIEKTG
jgi:chemotaxis protein MotB